MPKNQNFWVLHGFQIKLGASRSTFSLGKAISMDRGYTVVHFLADTLVERHFLSVIIKIPINIFPNGNIKTEKISFHIHNIHFTALQNPNAMNFLGPGVAYHQILVVTDIFIIRIEHGGKMVCRAKKLQSRFLRRGNIFQNRGVSMAGIKSMGMNITFQFHKILFPFLLLQIQSDFHRTMVGAHYFLMNRSGKELLL